MSNTFSDGGGPTRHCELYGEPQHEATPTTESDLYGESESRCDERDLYTRRPHFPAADESVTLSFHSAPEVRVA